MLSYKIMFYQMFQDLLPVLEKEDTSSRTKSAEKNQLSRNKRSKGPETAENQGSDHLLAVQSKDSVESPLAKQISPTAEKQTPAKKLSKKSDKTTKLKLSLLNHSEEIKENILKPVSESNEFTFQSLILINEQNYPLNNSEKLELSSGHYNQNVLSLGFSDSIVKDYLKYPSVSKIMEVTMTAKSRLILSRWRKNMIKDLGEEGFSKHLTGNFIYLVSCSLGSL